jgi:hypothetical protein
MLNKVSEYLILAAGNPLALLRVKIRSNAVFLIRP